jgi:hypothetical protein
MKQSRVFFALFVIAGAGVFQLARMHEPAYAAGAGIAGILLHWRLSSGNDSDAENADASYFLGFLLTLVLLAAGLWSLASAGTPTATTQPTGLVLYQFLYDLGAGLTITIAGLAIRQVRTLSATREPAAAVVVAAPAPPPPALEPLLLRELINAVNRLPESITARETADPAVRAQRSTENLEHALAESAPRIIATMHQLEDSVTKTAAIMTRSASSLGDALTQTTDRIDTQIGEVLTVLAKERAAMLTQFEEWRKAVEQAHQLMIDGHQTLDSEYRRGLLAVSAAGRSFTQLSNQVAADMKRLPNPAERLEHLWTNVDVLDEKLRDSIGGASERLTTLGAQAQAAGASVERLAASLKTASTQIERGGGEMSASLERELKDVSKVLDDFVTLLDDRVATMGAA